MRKQIGKNIRNERLARNISMEELAEMLELSPAFVGLIERGQRGASVKNLIKISNIFNVDVDSLINERASAIHVSENKGINPKIETVKSILFDFDDEEIDFVILMIKNLRKLRQKTK